MKIHQDSLNRIPDGIKSFPTALMNEKHAMQFHNQTLLRLDKRGGMTYSEIIGNIFGVKLKSYKDTTDRAYLLRLIRDEMFYEVMDTEDVGINDAFCEKCQMWIGELDLCPKCGNTDLSYQA